MSEQQQYDNTNRGAMFRNDKQGNQNRPDYRGSLNVNGVDFWISGWIKESQKDGSKFMSLSVQPKEQRGNQQGGGQKDTRQPASAGAGRQEQPDNSGYGAPDIDDGQIPF